MFVIRERLYAHPVEWPFAKIYFD